MLRLTGSVLSHSCSVHRLQLPRLGAARRRRASVDDGKGNQGEHSSIDRQFTKLSGASYSTLPSTFTLSVLHSSSAALP
jgi:hypothetical protein